MPEWMPVVIDRGDGAHVWDLDGNRFIEYGQGLRAVTLGHAEPRVSAAAAGWLSRGASFSRPSRIELEAADTFLDLVGAEMVKFCKDGSTAVTAAVKLARAATGRDTVAVCADHPFLSQNDWFIGTTPMAAGIPQAVRDLTVSFPYGSLAALAETLDAHRPACVVMEAVRDESDPTDYLRAAIDACRQRGVVFVLDEMITGFRWSARGGPGALRPRPRPLHVRQGARQRALRQRARRPPRPDADGRAGRAGRPGLLALVHARRRDAQPGRRRRRDADRVRRGHGGPDDAPGRPPPRRRRPGRPPARGLGVRGDGGAGLEPGLFYPRPTRERFSGLPYPVPARAHAPRRSRPPRSSSQRLTPTP